MFANTIALLRPENYEKRLAIVVPYRDRAENLSQFVPHIRSYFERDKLDRLIPYRVHVVEQLGAQPFNSGYLRNVGFHIAAGSSDYTVFHDVDYAPIWADYSYTEKPYRLIWHGLVLREDYDTFFGGVVGFPNEQFVAVNGYSNEYWGWGAEDKELMLRCKLLGFDFGKRDGSYLALPHEHNGRDRFGRLNEVAKKNQRVFAERRKNLEFHRVRDGLNSIKFEIASSEKMTVEGKELENFLHHKVVLNT
jgi:N-terminal domain of galactosyltransferase/N-terminal region of glycosyl transferase group 7